MMTVNDKSAEGVGLPASDPPEDAPLLGRPLPRRGSGLDGTKISEAGASKAVSAGFGVLDTPPDILAQENGGSSELGDHGQSFDSDLRNELARERQRNAQLSDEIEGLNQCLSSRVLELDSYRTDLGEWLNAHANWLEKQHALEARAVELAVQLDEARRSLGGAVSVEMPEASPAVVLDESVPARLEALHRETVILASHGRSLEARNLQLKRVLSDQTSRILAQGFVARLGGALRNARRRRALQKDTATIEAFLEQMEANALGVPAEGRRSRILAYLLGGTDFLDDFIVFDREYYRNRYDDVANSAFEPLVHFIRHGGRERRNPSILFDTEYYVSQAPECVAMNEIPIVHYIKWGSEKNFSPHPLFDQAFYLDRHPDVRLSGCNPLVHFLEYPGCVPHPLFDNDFYASQSPELWRTNENMLIHYITIGARAGLDPSKYFETKYYFAANPDVAESGNNPLVHFLATACVEYRMPNPNFDTRFYLATYPDVACSGLNPLVHYVSIGRAEGRLTRAPASERRRALVADSGPIVLMVDAAYPRPDQDSGSLDQIHFIGIFQRLGFQVHFAADVEFSAQSAHRNSLEDTGAICVSRPEYSSIEDFVRQHADRLGACFLSRVHFGGRHLNAIRALAPRAKIIFNAVDLHHLREEREADLSGDAAALTNAAATKTLEVNLAKCADATIVVSDVEAKALRSLAPEAKIVVVPLVRDYPALRTAEFDQRNGIGFIGGYAHRPNVDAVIWFLENVWPEVRAALNDVTFYVIGANLPKELSDRADPGVQFVGFAPDLSIWLNRLRLTVAPLRYGAGAKGKIVSSLGYGVPCVGSPIAVEGMGLTDGREVKVATTAKQFVSAVVNLYNDKKRWTELSDSGLVRIRNFHSVAHGQELVASVLDAIGAAGRAQVRATKS